MIFAKTSSEHVGSGLWLELPHVSYPGRDILSVVAFWGEISTFETNIRLQSPKWKIRPRKPCH